MPVLLHILSAFGLSSAAGLNAYIPLLLTAIASRLGLVHLTAPFNTLESPWIIALLVLLLIVEIIVDKVPGADHVNDLIQTLVRPVAGAILFAAAAGLLTHLDPKLLLALGLLPALGVHSAKAVARPAITASTLGVGTPIVSILEDFLSFTTTLLALFAPILIIAFFLLVAYIAYRAFHKLKSRRRPAPASLPQPL